MNSDGKEQSNPFSTGGGGTIFETRVQTAFVVAFLTQTYAPCLPPWPIHKIKLQGKYDGYDTDDLVLVAQNPTNGHQARLFCQIKHDVHITEKDTVFAEVIQAFWSDFSGPDFDPSNDRIALVTGALSKTDIRHVRPLLDWARHSHDATEFFAKINTARFSSETKRKKLASIRIHVENANGGETVSDELFWGFLKTLYLVGYDFDEVSEISHSQHFSLIHRSIGADAVLWWSRILDFVQTANFNAGTITSETIPQDISERFQNLHIDECKEAMTKLAEHGNYILDGIRSSVGGFSVPRIDQINLLKDLCEDHRFVILVGKRGGGKSSLLKKFQASLLDSIPSFCLRAEDFDKSHLDRVFNDIGINPSIEELRASLSLIPQKYLLVESLEKILELNDTLAFVQLLTFLRKSGDWTIVASCRDYALQPLAFNFLQPNSVSFTTLQVDGFDESEVMSLCETHPTLKPLLENNTLKPLLLSPFYADLAYRAVTSGATISATDGHREFRKAIWKSVIAQEHYRQNGMPIKRRSTFISIAKDRAKRMVYGVPEQAYDSEVLLSLERDNLIRRDSETGIVLPSHDVLEDWALEEAIDIVYSEESNDIPSMLEKIGQEPAMNRAFRLWLQYKIQQGDNMGRFICDILRSDVAPVWQDEAITAVLGSESIGAFVNEMDVDLKADECALLKRFCFMLRVACQAPQNPTGLRQQKATQSSKDQFTAPLLLAPNGSGWRAIIVYLYENRNSLHKSMRSHEIALLKEWAEGIELNTKDDHRPGGLLALHILSELGDSYSYRREKQLSNLLEVVIKSYPFIKEEFEELLRRDVLAKSPNQRRDRPSYVEHLCEKMFSVLESGVLCKHNPDLLIEVAMHEWISTKEDNKDRRHMYYAGGSGVEGYFGLNHIFECKMFPVSGLKGPFRNLFYYNWPKGLRFILDLANQTVRCYAHSTLDAENESYQLEADKPEPLIPTVKIHLNDGHVISQYCSSRLWIAYRGKSVAPDILQCAMMAFENWLVGFVEIAPEERVSEVYDFTLRNSNNVMITAVLASVAVGFHEKVGKAALPLLRTTELYHLDRARSVQESGGNEINWHGGLLDRDPIADIYAEERRTAALREWRKEHLESIACKFQFTELRQDALDCIDHLKKRNPVTEADRFLFLRIDSREWTPVHDKENNRILFENKKIDADLKQLQEESAQHMEVSNRQTALYLWACKNYAKEATENPYYDNIKDVISDTKQVIDELNSSQQQELFSLCAGSTITVAAVLIRDYMDELSDDDISWCIELIVNSILSSADDSGISHLMAIRDKEGPSAAAGVLPILYDFIEGDEQAKEIFLRALISVLIHQSEAIRDQAANGVKEFLWSRDADLAQRCIDSCREFARYDLKLQAEIQKIPYPDDYTDGNRREYELEQRSAYREKFVQNKIELADDRLSLNTHSASYILQPCLMIPDESIAPNHVQIYEDLLGVFILHEQDRWQRGRASRNKEINHQNFGKFTKSFTEHLYANLKLGHLTYIEILKKASLSAPSLVQSILIRVECIADREERPDVYWRLWAHIAEPVQEIAILNATKDEDHQSSESRRLIRSLLHGDSPWQKIDYETKPIARGKVQILEFASKTSKHPDVFCSIASLVYHFPELFFEEAVLILAKAQEEENGIRLVSVINTAYYLENAIQRYIQKDNTGPLKRDIYDACVVLLDAVIETASSRAYYLREHLIRSRRVH